MPFTSTSSLTAADVNNFLRGLVRDNTTYTKTGAATETDLASTTITGGTISATGGIYVVAAGTVTNSAAGAKTIDLKFGATNIATVSRTGANAQDWLIEAWGFNIATNAQRWVVRYSTTDATTVTGDYITSAIDTTANVILKLTGELANGADTITQNAFDVFVVQIA